MGKNEKAGSLKVPVKALNILNQYEPLKASNEDFVFPYLKALENKTDVYDTQRKIRNANHVLNEGLEQLGKAAKIDKKLSMHIARHSFGNISGDKISIQMLQKLYRHSSITTTIGYQANFIHKDADDALDSVISF